MEEPGEVGVTFLNTNEITFDSKGTLSKKNVQAMIGTRLWVEWEEEMGRASCGM